MCVCARRCVSGERIASHCTGTCCFICFGIIDRLLDLDADHLSTTRSSVSKKKSSTHQQSQAVLSARVQHSDAKASHRAAAPKSVITRKKHKYFKRRSPVVESSGRGNARMLHLLPVSSPHSSMAHLAHQWLSVASCVSSHLRSRSASS